MTKKRFRRLLTATLFILAFTSFVRIYRVSEISMNYTLVDGDLVVVDNFSAGIHIPSFHIYIDRHIYSNEEGIHRGDILAFRHPLEHRLYLKRCVALPGDSLFQKNKSLYLQIESDSSKTRDYASRYSIPAVVVDGEYWLENPYEPFYDIVHDDRVYGPKELIDYPLVKLPPHMYFFMGDFRDNSTDSRFFGPVPYERIYYKVRYILKLSRGLESLASIKNF